jgi:hypothetical protein
MLSGLHRAPFLFSVMTILPGPYYEADVTVFNNGEQTPAELRLLFNFPRTIEDPERMRDPPLFEFFDAEPTDIPDHCTDRGAAVGKRVSLNKFLSR